MTCWLAESLPQGDGLAPPGRSCTQRRVGECWESATCTPHLPRVLRLGRAGSRASGEGGERRAGGQSCGGRRGGKRRVIQEKPTYIRGLRKRGAVAVAAVLGAALVPVLVRRGRALGRGGGRAAAGAGAAALGAILPALGAQPEGNSTVSSRHPRPRAPPHPWHGSGRAAGCSPGFAQVRNGVRIGALCFL